MAPSGTPDGALSSAHARLAVVADHLARYEQDLADIATGLHADHHADVVTAAYEAERTLRQAQRLVRRAAALAERGRGAR